MASSLCVGVTDWDWFDFLRRRSNADEVNFWRPGGGRLSLEPGTPFLFKLKNPRNVIAGFGYFEYSETMRVDEAWEFYGEKNGAQSLAQLGRLIAGNRRKGLTVEDAIGCVLLAQPTFFEPDDWVPQPRDWAPNTVSVKYYDINEPAGAALWAEVARRTLPHPSLSLGVPFGGQGTPNLVVPRLGQGTFRKVVLAAYANRCAVTGERTIPVLQASHIKPFADVKGHEIENGISLRSDFHTLFDRGYVTVTKEHVFRVSRRLRDDFSNGRVYYEHDGQPIHLPSDLAQRPRREYLEWHGDEVFKDSIDDDL